MNSEMSLWICPECFVPLPLSPPTAADGGDAQDLVALMQMVHLQPESTSATSLDIHNFDKIKLSKRVFWHFLLLWLWLSPSSVLVDFLSLVWCNGLSLED